ncbi:hypothetical protein KFL_005840080 [Klebsormidium nitens]|uniref:Cilia- and flagella-associated protein 251 n=1 Tax=Klebsormidium nitens TaxID=105231 RepID=A0A1Y1IGK1_KLENI|nr:hypothetical protein KFL_005840080 [Klebsormidium nitens]|eukprot:GAQ89975.1 hypothetical protein KFL_005840080 [Klebsormidium nitens]
MAIPQALTFDSVYGHSWELPGGVVSLTTESRDAVCYAAGHTAVIYEKATGQQIPLQGHRHALRSLAVSPDKLTLATADVGDTSLLVLWDALTGKPLWTASQERTGGIVAMDFSADARFLATLSNTGERGNLSHCPLPRVLQAAADVSQEVSIWDLQSPEEGPILITPVADGSLLTSLRFNPESHRELVSTGADRVLFWQRVVHEDTSESLQPVRPLGSIGALKPSSVSLTVSVFVPGTTTVVTGTSDGGLLVWEEERTEAARDSPLIERRAVKNLRIHTAAITALAAAGAHVVSGGADGYVRFFDARLRLVAWFEDMDAGGITSLSFATAGSVPLSDAAFYAPDFVVGTTNAKIVSMETASFDDDPKSSRRAGQMILAGNSQAVAAISAHPGQPHVTLIGDAGLQQVYDYAPQTLLLEKKHAGQQGCAICYSPNGTLIAVGFGNGAIQIQNSATLDELFTFRTTLSALTHLTFAPTGTALAAADTSFAVSLITFGHGKAGDKWEAVGKVRAHNDVVTGLRFGARAGAQPCLTSCAEDGNIVTYDLEGAAPGEGLHIKSVTAITSPGLPTGLASLEGSQETAEFLISDDACKLKATDVSDTATCRMTWAAPAFGAPIHKLVPFTSCQNDQQYLAYATKERVAGLIKLPLTGDPNRTMGLLAQPGNVSCLAVGFDGETLVTASGNDGILTFWRVDASALDAQAETSAGLDAAARLEGGREGAAHREARDFFTCCQIRSQEAGFRCAADAVPADRVQELSNTLEFYPSRAEAREMAAEARGTGDGNAPAEITLESYLEVLEQHRPAEGLEESQLERAFQDLGADPATGALSREKLLQMLLEEGEPLTREELDACLSTMAGQPTSATAWPEELGVPEFAALALGFENPQPEIEAV